MFKIFGAYIDNLNDTSVHVLCAIIVVLLTLYLVTSIRWILMSTVNPPDKNYNIVLELMYTVILSLGLWLALLEVVSYDLLGKILQAFMVGFGFSVQTPILSFVSGLIMWQNADIRVGDRITVREKTGTIKKITLLRTVLEETVLEEHVLGQNKTPSEYIIYNNQLINNIVQRVR